MKPLYKLLVISIISTCSYSLVFGQVPLKPLFEEFTSATCYPCATANSVLDPILEDNMETHTAIKYQMSWPGSGDIYFTAEGDARKDYYEVEYAPLLNVNAVEYDPSVMTQSVYDSFLPFTTPVSIDITSASIDDDYIISVEVEISTSDDVPTALTAHVVVVEKRTVGNVAYNGETEFFNVMMKMLPDASGTSLTIENSGDSETINVNFDMNETNMEGPDDLAVIVFVQDDANKSIKQSEYGDVAGEFDTHVVNIQVEDNLGNALDGAEVFLSGYGFQNTDASGITVYPEVFNGSFDYLVTYPGLLDAVGDFQVSDADQTITVVVEIPDYLFYDDLSDQTSGWTNISSGIDYISWFDGEYTILRQSGTLNPLMLISPEIDISNAGVLIFYYSASTGEPEIGFGTIDNPSNPDSFNELIAYFPEGDFIEYQYDLSGFTGSTSNVNFCWSHKTSTFSWVSMDYLIITENSVSIDEIDALRNLVVYPNPSNGTINIDLDEMMESVSIYNGIGELLLNESVNGFEKSIDVSKFIPGLYSIVVQTDKGKVMKNVVVH